MENAAEIISASGGGNVWAILAVLASGAVGKYAWDFYKKWITLRHKEKDEARKDTNKEKLLDRKEKNEYKDDLKARIEDLEKKLDAAIQEKVKLVEQIGELKVKIARIETKLEMVLEGSRSSKTTG